MSDHVIRRGLDIPIKGAATGPIIQLDPPDSVAYAPTELRGLVAKPAVREGDVVKRGTPLFFHKSEPRLVFRSPMAGKVREIRRGRRRVITDVVVERVDDGGAEGDDAVEPQLKKGIESIRTMDRDAAVEAALSTGMWGAFEARPLGKIPMPSEQPQAILVGAMETGPLQPGEDTLLDEEDQEAFEAAFALLSRLAPTVHLAVRAGSSHPGFLRAKGVQRHTFAGPHPAGDPAVQVNLVDPPRGSNQVWTIRAWDAALMGRALLTGEFPAERVYAAVGAGVVRPRFVRTVLGAPLAHIVGDVTDGAHRWIRGSVLTGEAVDSERWASFRRRAVHVLPKKVPRRMFGWALPMFGLWSFHRAFLSAVTGSKPQGGVDMRPGLWGGERAMVPLGAYDRVVASPDILPEFLFKSIVAGDLEESIQLGLLDMTEEEAALCTFICPSKIQFDSLLREGLALYEREA